MFTTQNIIRLFKQFTQGSSEHCLPCATTPASDSIWIRRIRAFIPLLFLISTLALAQIAIAQEDNTHATVTVSIDGDGSGVVFSSPPGIQCGDQINQCSASFSVRTPVTLSAKPAAGGSAFAGWSVATGSATACSGSNENCSFIVTVNSTVNAHFTSEKTQQYKLVVNPVGNGKGVITSSPSGIQCGAQNGSCVASFPAGTKITLAVTPVNSEFQGWSSGTGSASICDGSIQPCQLTLSEDSSTVATFNKK